MKSALTALLAVAGMIAAWEALVRLLPISPHLLAPPSAVAAALADHPGILTRGLYDRLHYAVWRGWAHDRIFSDQDKVLIEALVPGPERLARSDVGVIAWRKFAGAAARRPTPLQSVSRDVA